MKYQKHKLQWKFTLKVEKCQEFKVFWSKPHTPMSAHASAPKNLLLFAFSCFFLPFKRCHHFFHLFVLHSFEILHGRHRTPAASWWRSKFVFISRPIEATSGEWKSAESTGSETKAQCCTISRGSRHLVPMISISRIMFNAARQEGELFASIKFPDWDSFCWFYASFVQPSRPSILIVLCVLLQHIFSIEWRAKHLLRDIKFPFYSEQQVYRAGCRETRRQSRTLLDNLLCT